MAEYLTATHPDAFVDMEVKEGPSPQYGSKLIQLCHVCKGHGGWNLKLNAYGKEGDPPKMRHFRASCSHCWGWGWIDPDSKDATCPKHEYTEETIGNCLHLWTCKHCGLKREVDSSG